MTDTPELLPCPFCGCRVRLYTTRRRMRVECHGCGTVMTRPLPSAECQEIVRRQLIAGWNRRAILDHLRDGSDELGAMQRAHLEAEARAEACKAVKP